MRNEFEIRADITAIFLPRRNAATLEAIIDTADFSLVNAFQNSWLAHKRDNSGVFEAVRYDYVDGRQIRMRMHRLLIGEPDGLQADHINGDTLDNRRSNLRVVTQGQNMQNVRVRSGSSSGARGVTWHKATAKWRARAQVYGRMFELGVFDSVSEADRVVSEFRAQHMPFAVERV